MAKLVINIGQTANDKSGDPLRTAFDKINQNFTEVYNTLAVELSAVNQNIVPVTDNLYDLGSPTNRFRHLYVAPGTVYLGDVKLSNVAGKLVATKVINPGEETEYEDPEDSNAFSNIGGNSSGASLGNFKIQGNYIGTVNNPDTGGWGGYDMAIDPGGESWAGIYIPGLVNQDGGSQLQIYNTKTINSQISLSAQGGVIVNVANGLMYNFQADGALRLPAGSTISGAGVVSPGGQSILLTPDPAFGQGQGLRIYPTTAEVEHLHLTSNDPATVDLFLGDDDKYVKVSRSGEITVGTKGSDSQAHWWTFGNDGLLSLGATFGGIYADQITGKVSIADALSSTGSPAMPSTAIHIGGDDAFVISRGQGGALNPYWRFGADGIIHLSATGDGTEPGVLRSVTGITLKAQHPANPFATRDWSFGGNGHLVFPDSTHQTTAWTGGRVVSVPSSSAGSAGDKAGDLAFNNGYIYYCVANYGASPSETFTVTNVGENSNAIKVNMVNNPNYTVPQAGWTTIVGGVTMTLSAFSGADINGTDFDFLFDVNSGPIPSTIILTSNVPYTNIWKRVAWSNDTW